MLNDKLTNTLELLKNEYGKTAADLSEWIKTTYNVIGYSTPSISIIKKSHDTDDLKYQKLLKYLKEYIAFCKNEGSIELIADPKLALYLNQVFYLYFFDEDIETKTHCISRAVVTIGNSNKTVKIKNVKSRLSTDYLGEFNIHPVGQHLIFTLRTLNTGEKNLYMNFIISPEKIPPIAIGQYSNIDKKGALVAGVLVLESIGSLDKAADLDLTSKMFKIGTKEFEGLDANIKRFLIQKEKNYLKVTTGIFDQKDLKEFFIRQEQKKQNLRPTKPKKGIFISAPMSTVSNYESFRKEIILLAKKLKEIFNCDVYFAGSDKETIEHFDYPSISFSKATYMIDYLDKFILIYPTKLLSSVLVELGWALGTKKSCIVFVKDRNDLPYLLRTFEHPNARIIEYKSIDNIIRLFEKHKKDLFKR